MSMLLEEVGTLLEEGVEGTAPCPAPPGLDENVFIRVLVHVFCDGGSCTMHIQLLAHSRLASEYEIN